PKPVIIRVPDPEEQDFYFAYLEGDLAVRLCNIARTIGVAEELQKLGAVYFFLEDVVFCGKTRKELRRYVQAVTEIDINKPTQIITSKAIAKDKEASARYLGPKIQVETPPTPETQISVSRRGVTVLGRCSKCKTLRVLARLR
ncbi:MAG: hypothetical protein MJA29_07240, partial [Candidatus Omnitrophica bacterium]|nr:hypothetical protein [Candidatus Omnitrophota bacterium]